MKRAVRIITLLTLVALMMAQGAAFAEVDILTASTATPARHWWEDVLWKRDVVLDNRSIEITHVGEAVYVDYVRFVNIKTGQEVLWTAFDSLRPSDAVVKRSSLQDYDASSNLWAVRTDSMAHIGGATLYAGANASPPNLTFNPGLSGRYDIYLGVRATHFPVKVGLGLVGSPARTVHAGDSDHSETVPGTDSAAEDEATMSHVIIDDEAGVYFAWPSIAQRSNGELLAVTYAGEAHTESHGRVVLYRSHDNGLTWDEGTIIADTILDDRDPGILVTGDDTIIVSSRVAWWRNGTDSQGIDANQAQDLLSTYHKGYIIRSTDGGRTWSEMHPYPFQPKGPIQRSDGSLFVVSKESATRFQAYTSNDLGDTWQTLGRIDGLPPSMAVDGSEVSTNYSEPHFVETSPGRIILYIRAHPSDPRTLSRETSNLWLATSDDGGRTWSKPVQTTVRGYPPHALLLRDGRILLTYGHRWHPYGQRAQLSDDGVDFTKYREMIIRDDAIDSDLGYPSSIQLDDGRILTVYYQKPVLKSKPALMGTIWSINESLSDLWIGSPRRGGVLQGTIPVRLDTSRPTLRSVEVRVDDRPLYQGTSLPTDLVLRPSELEPGSHRLSVAVQDGEGSIYRQSSEFVVEHVRFPTVEWGEQLSGRVIVALDSTIPPDHMTYASVALIPTHPRGEGHELFHGTVLPARLPLDTLAVADGPYTLQVELATRSGVESTTRLPLVVDNWEVLEDAILPPSNSGWFGVIDRLKATKRSEDWEFVGDDKNLLFEDADRIRPAVPADQFLVWELPRLRSFTFTMYTPAPGEDGSVDTVAASVMSALSLAVSADGQAWERVSFSTEVTDTTESNHGPWLKLAVKGSLSDGTDAAFIRLSLSSSNHSATDRSAELQLGHVTLMGLRSPN